MRKGISPYNGVLLFNKPVGGTSHDVIQDLRRTLAQRRIGHTGTLDPLAEGLMVICLGSATKIARFLTGFDKTYEGEFTFGLTSRTFDREGVDPDAEPASVPELSSAEVDGLLQEFTGRIQQRVPAYSAVRVDGKRLYQMARRGEEVELPEREVNIKEIAVLDWQRPRLAFRVTCSSGTYVRSLADDIGRRLGCGAYLSALKRTSVGRLQLSDALTLDAVQSGHSDGTLTGRIRAYAAVLPYGAFLVSDEFRPRVIEGRRVSANDITSLEGRFAAGEYVLLKDSQGDVLAVGTAGIGSERFEPSDSSEIFKYVRVLN